MKIKYKYSQVISFILCLALLTTGITFSRYATTFTLTTPENNTVQVQAPTASSETNVPGTEIPFPGEIPTVSNGGVNSEEVIIFDYDNATYQAIGVDDLLDPNYVFPTGYSLYIPESAALNGGLVLEKNNVINWEVDGDIVIEPNIEIHPNSKTFSITMLSKSGDIIMNNITIGEDGNNKNRRPNNIVIASEKGCVYANESLIYANNNITINAKNNISIEDTIIQTNGNIELRATDVGVLYIQGAIIKAINGTVNAYNLTVEGTANELSEPNNIVEPPLENNLLEVTEMMALALIQEKLLEEELLEALEDEIPAEVVEGEIPEKVIEEPPEVVEEEIPEKESEEPPEVVEEETPEKESEEPSEVVEEEIPEKVIEEPPEVVEEEIPEKVIEEPPETVVEEPPEKVVEKPTEEVPGRTPEKAIEETSKEIVYKV